MRQRVALTSLASWMTFRVMADGGLALAYWSDQVTRADLTTVGSHQQAHQPEPGPLHREKALRGSGTTRNGRTVTALLDMVDG